MTRFNRSHTDRLREDDESVMAKLHKSAREENHYNLTLALPWLIALVVIIVSGRCHT